MRLSETLTLIKGMIRPRITAMNVAIWLVFIAVALLMWASDKITLEGEHTIYTVQCRNGNWEGWRCAGVMVAGDRYRFRASRSRQEVVFWIAGSKRPSGRYTNCVVKDRDNWTCTADPDQPPTIVHALVNGRPDSSGAGFIVPFHAVRKWKWWVLRSGIHPFSNADY